MPNHYVYTVEDEPYVGTLEEYAHALQEGHYAGLNVSRAVWEYVPTPTGAVDLASPFVRRVPDIYCASSWDDYATYIVRLGNEETSYRLDLLA